MAQTLTWVFQLYNNVSGPAQQAAQSVGALAKALGVTAQAANKVTGSMKVTGTQTALTATRIGFASAAWGQLFRAVGRATGALIDAGESLFDYGLKASIFGENTTLALQAILHSTAYAAQAKGAFQGLTGATSLGIERITRYGSAYLQLGDSLDSAIVKIKVLGALQVAKGGGEQGAAAADRLQGVILRFMTGELPPSRNQLKMMLADAGTTVEELERQVVIYSKGRVTLEQAKADLLKNQIPSDVLVTPLIAAMQKSIGGATVGSTAAGAANASVGGLIQRIQDNLFIDFDFSRLPGFNTLKSVLRNLVTLTQPGGAFQKNMQDFATSFSQFLDPLKGPEGLAKMKEFFTSLTTLAEGALPVVAAVAKAVGVIVNYLAKPLSADAGPVNSSRADQYSRGLGLPKGVTVEPPPGWNGFRQITLPTMDLSRGGGAAPPAADLSRARSTPAPFTLPPITLNLNIHTAATNKDEAKKISDAVQDTLPTALQRAFENLATQGGY